MFYLNSFYTQILNTQSRLWKTIEKEWFKGALFPPEVTLIYFERHPDLLRRSPVFTSQITAIYSADHCSLLCGSPGRFTSEVT
jgi:hypothetical protein